MDDFEEIYNNIEGNLSNLKPIEKKYIYYIKKLIKLLYLPLIFAPLEIALMYFKLYYLLVLVVMFSSVGVTTFIIIYIIKNHNNLDHTEYLKTYTNTVTIPLLNHIFGNSECDFKKQFSQQCYNKCSFNEKADTYENTLSISTKLKIGNNIKDMVLADVETEKLSSDSDRNITVFKGIAGIINSNLSITDDIYIKKNKSIFFGSNNNENKVEIDSSEFEKLFDIECNNKILAMQILTPAVIATLTDYVHANKIPFEININTDGNVYFRFSDIIFFDTHTNHVSTKENIKKLYDNIKYISNIITTIYNSISNSNQ